MAEKTETGNTAKSGTPRAAAAPGTPPRKQLGAKEPIIFKWKLLGSSAGMVLTLFKATEREDIEAQFARIRRDGYYKDLCIVDIDAKVVQPKKVREAIDKERRVAASAAETREKKKAAAKKKTVSKGKAITLKKRKAKPSAKKKKKAKTPAGKKPKARSRATTRSKKLKKKKRGTASPTKRRKK